MLMMRVKGTGSPLALAASSICATRLSGREPKLYRWEGSSNENISTATRWKSDRDAGTFTRFCKYVGPRTSNCGDRYRLDKT
jgi:hypothetical protein